MVLLSIIDIFFSGIVRFFHVPHFKVFSPKKLHEMSPLQLWKRMGPASCQVSFRVPHGTILHKLLSMVVGCSWSWTVFPLLPSVRPAGLPDLADVLHLLHDEVLRASSNGVPNARQVAPGKNRQIPSGLGFYQPCKKLRLIPLSP